MASDPLLPRVRTLLTERIDSVAQLELLLFMYARRERAWTPGQASAEFRISEDWTREQMALLTQRGLCRQEGDGYRYGAGADLDGAVADLAHAYRMFPVTVVGAIYSMSAPPGGSPNVRNFAEAFRLRRDPRDTES